MAAEVECEYEDLKGGHISKIVSEEIVLVSFPDWKEQPIPVNKLTFIMRSIDQMTEEESEEYRDRFDELGYKLAEFIDKHVKEHNLIIGDSFRRIAWLLEKSIWWDSEDFVNGNIKQKQI